MHNDEDDHDALLASLPSAAGYVGLLGSRRRLAGRLARLRASGVSESDLSRLKAPIGLDIGARSAWEIAASVMAEIVQEGQSARSRRTASMFSPEAA
jgi:xanthine dehydrogenase accessory factor